MIQVSRFLLLPVLFLFTQVPAQPDKTTKKQVFPTQVKKPLDFTGMAINYYVNQSAASGGDGSVQRPFRNIGEALTAAAAKQHPVVVNIGSGTYVENLVISSNTLLRGVASGGRQDKTIGCTLNGTIQNNGPFILELFNLRLSGSSAPGAIVVNNNAATTLLHNITIDHATRYGIFQSGGSLLADTLTVVNTAPGLISLADKQSRTMEVSVYGTAILLNNVQADFSNLTLRGNVKGLMADGSACAVIIRQMLAERNSLNPFLKDLLVCRDYGFSNGLGCIEVVNGAKLQMQSVRILDNDFCGLSVRNGALVSGYDLVILRSNKVLCNGNDEHGGINVSARSGARVDLDQFETGNAVIGLQLAKATATCANGKVQHNLIGIHVKDPPPGFSFTDLQKNVIFLDNQRNLDAATVPLPGKGQ